MKTVTVRNVTFGDGNPKICIPLTARDMAQLEAQSARAAVSFCDLVEWRADFFMEPEEQFTAALHVLRDRLGDKPLLFTFRTKAEGGEREILTEEYERLNAQAAASGLADLIDIELNRGEETFCRICDAAHAHGVPVVGSFHDFSMTPSRERIEEILCRMQELGADITKAAVMPRCERDVLSLLEASVEMKLQYADRPFITMSMGALGAVSRLCGTLTGSAVTFASAGQASAPGQLDAGTVADVLKSCSI